MNIIWIEAQIVLRKSHNMQISEKATISASADKVWNHLQTLQGVEEYLPIVTKSEVKGSGLGTTRTCDIAMGEQKFQIQETLVKLDDSQKSLTISIDTKINHVALNQAPPKVLTGLKMALFSCTNKAINLKMHDFS